MFDYPIYLYGLAIKPRHRELVVRVYFAHPQMLKAPRGGNEPSSMAIPRSPPHRRVALYLVGSHQISRYHPIK